jgi:hypothetical protein
LNHQEEVLRQEILARKLATPEQLDGELTIPFMENCSSKVNLYLSLVRPEDVENAYNKPARIEAGKEQAKKNRARQWWSGDGTTRVQEAGKIAGEFQKLYPQFASIEENTAQIVNFIKSRGEIFSLEAVIGAYQTLCSQGLIWVTPENCGLEGSEMIRGKVLTSRTDFYKILEPVKVLSDEEKEQQRVTGLSADEYAAEFLPEPISRREIQHNQKEGAEFEKRHQEIDFDVADVWQTILDALSEENLGIRFNDLEYIIRNPKLIQKLQEMNAFWTVTPSTEYHAGVSSLVDHRKPHIPSIARPITLDPPESPKRIDMDKLLALPADEFQRVVNGTPGLRELLDGEQK